MRVILVLLMGLVAAPGFSQSDDSLFIRKIYDEALVRGQSYEILRTLCKDVGARLSGSPEAEKAVQWGYQTLTEIGFDTIYLQEIEVPKWTRGSIEKASLNAQGKTIALDICALGGSVATEGELTAEVIEVKSLDELKDLGEEKVKGKIVFYNRPMDPRLINTFAAYGGCVDQRYAGAGEAVKYGAVASICRSMNLTNDDHPHTGSMSYPDEEHRIPTAAVSTNGAEMLSSLIKKDPMARLTIQLDCQYEGKARSFNVIAEMRGTENAKKIITFGGHLDSWDKGEGAHDDGAGIAHSIEALRLLKATGYKPKNTLRVVLFMNEENGNMGGKTYARIAGESDEEHIYALESDRGGFSPRGFSINGTDEEVATIAEWKTLLEPYGIHFFEKSYAGVDISPLKNGEGAPFPNMIQLGLVPDPQRYFDFHHSDADVFEAVNKRELELGAATMASMIYLLDLYGVASGQLH